MNHTPSHWLPLICQILSVFNSPHVYWLSTRQPVQLIKKKSCALSGCDLNENIIWPFSLPVFFLFFFYLCTPHITTITDGADMMHAGDACHIWCSITVLTVYCIENDAIVIRAVKLPCVFPGAPLVFNGAPRNIQGNLDRWSWWWWLWWWWWSISSRTADIHQTVMSKN